MRIAALATIMATPFVTPAAAQTDRSDGARRTLGRAHLFTNDYLGDGHDRWRTGSFSYSLLRGQDWQGRPPEAPFSLMEYRWRSALIAAGRVGRDRVDRPHVGELTFGLHSHAALGALDLAFGVDLVALGPQTRMADFQRRFHDRFGLDGPYGTDMAIADAVRLEGHFALSGTMPLSRNIALRPFAEMAVGVEDRATIGADLFLGPIWDGALLVRDETTGHPVLAIAGPRHGLTVTLGADWTAVGQSLYLPDGYKAEDQRLRARAGLHWQISARHSMFYGLSWHEREFVGQEEDQVVGALRLAWMF